MADPYIRLERFGMVTYVNGRTQGYRMQIRAIDAQGMPNEIFVYERGPFGALSADQFTNVASPADIEEYPVGMPLLGGTYFRLDAVDVIFRNITLADDAWRAIQNDVTELIQTLKYFEDLTLLEVVDFGSSSSSSSA